jgi:hypothetical protein
LFRALFASAASLLHFLSAEQTMSSTSHSNGSSAKPPAVRDANGRFVKGNPGGPGNPFARKVAMLRRTLINFVTEDDMKHVAFVLKERAMGGDLVAIKLLLQYVVGKPSETVDPDRLDIEERKLKEEAATAALLDPREVWDMMYEAGPCQAEHETQDMDHGEDEPSTNDEDGDAQPAKPAMTRLAESLARMIHGHVAAEDLPSANGGNGAASEDEPSTNGESRRRRRRRRR